MIDLHLHTKYSDGTDTLIELLKKAQANNLEYISITDHDNCNSYFELNNINVKKYYNGKIIPGIEIKCGYEGRLIEVLGYKIDINKMKNWADEFYKNKTKDILQQKYFDLLYDKCIKMGLILNKKENIEFNNKTDWASLTIYKEIKRYHENKEKVPKDFWETFNTFSKKYCGDRNHILYIDKTKDYPTLQDAIEIIKKCGGLVFLPHLFIYKWAEDIEKLINDILENYDVDGIECYHSEFSEDNIEYLLNLCKQRNYYMSGGSDYHGKNKSDIKIAVGKGNLQISHEIIKEWYNDTNMKNLMQKNQEYIVNIIDNGFEGEGIAKVNNFTIFIPGAIKGEKIKILIVKVTSSYAFGKIIEIIEKSQSRIKNIDCNTYKRCGGCNLRHIKYEKTLELKRETVQNLVNKNLENKIVVKDTVGMENPFNYRNKAQYPVGLDKNNNYIIGVFANRTHNVIETKGCKIQNKQSEKIAKYICQFAKENNISVYNEKMNKGILRHIVIKVGVKTNEIMCILVINGRKINNEDKLIKNLINKFPSIKTIVKNINEKNTNVILGKENINIYGNGYIYDKLGDYIFKISPLSFYQINHIQTEKLYNLALSKAELTGQEVVLDLYCGIGTIGIFMANKAKKVYGIEIIEQAIEDAKENCKLNNISNAKYYAGDTEEILSELINNREIKPDLIVVDPPRKGLDNTTIENIVKIKSNKVIYISCNPATLIRDLAKLEKYYEIKEMQPLDMFPFTSHVECIVVLGLKQS